MPNHVNIDRLKKFAKRYARSNRLPQHEALNLVAIELGFPHWVALIARSKGGWAPTADNLAAIEIFVRRSYTTIEKCGNVEGILAHPVDQPIREGKIGEHGFRIFETLGDTLMDGDGWRIIIGEAQFAQPLVEIEVDHAETSPINDNEFLQAALAIADEQAAKSRAGIASEWPRRCTKPDADGVVRHPIYQDKAAEWFCLHCDGKISGTAIARNLWHCPGCGATPIDIFAERFWSPSGDKQARLVAHLEISQRPKPKIEIVDSRPKLLLNEKSVSSLLRMALIEDAANPGERLGALEAEIFVDEDNDACIVLDEALWPEDKEPREAQAVASMLGVELELAVTFRTFPFAWPDLGRHATSTQEYTRLLLEAHQEHGVILRGTEEA